jgi:hypothetical protein
MCCSFENPQGVVGQVFICVVVCRPAAFTRRNSRSNADPAVADLNPATAFSSSQFHAGGTIRHSRPGFILLLSNLRGHCRLTWATRNIQQTVRYTELAPDRYGVDQRTGFNVEVTIFIVAPVVILLFAAVVRFLGTNLGYKVLTVVIVLLFVLVKR